MCDGVELDVVEEEALLQLVGDPQLEATVLRAQLIRTESHVFLRIRHAPHAGGDEVAHLSGAQEVGHELETRSVPRVQIGTGRGLAVDLLDRKGQRPRRATERPPALGLCLKNPGRPEDPNRVDPFSPPQPEHDVGGRDGRPGHVRLGLLTQAARADLDPRAHAAPVAR